MLNEVEARIALIVLAVLSVLTIALGCTAQHYRGELKTANVTIKALNADILRANGEAKAKLDELTRDRDDKQAQLDKRAADQEKTDEAATKEIARLHGDLERAGVRVRVVAGVCRAGGGSAAGKAAGAAQAGSGYAGPATGLLPAENTRRLAGVIQEIETMSAAYASCRARLMSTPQ